MKTVPWFSLLFRIFSVTKKFSGQSADLDSCKVWEFFLTSIFVDSCQVRFAFDFLPFPGFLFALVKACSIIWGGNQVDGLQLHFYEKILARRAKAVARSATHKPSWSQTMKACEWRFAPLLWPFGPISFHKNEAVACDFTVPFFTVQFSPNFLYEKFVP